MVNFRICTDEELVSLLKTGNQGAFTEIYERYWQILLQKTYRILQNEEGAQDVVQEIFISLWQRRAIVDIRTLSAYLYQAARFSVLKAIRAQQTDDAFYSRLQQATTELISYEPLLFKEQQELIRQLMNSLPDECKEVFRLSREEDLSYKEIAEKLEISVKTVEKRISKALLHFRTGLSIGLCISVLFLV